MPSRGKTHYSRKDHRYSSHRVKRTKPVSWRNSPPALKPNLWRVRNVDLATGEEATVNVEGKDKALRLYERTSEPKALIALVDDGGGGRRTEVRACTRNAGIVSDGSFRGTAIRLDGLDQWRPW